MCIYFLDNRTAESGPGLSFSTSEPPLWRAGSTSGGGPNTNSIVLESVFQTAAPPQGPILFRPPFLTILLLVGLLWGYESGIPELS